jgi:predicted nucleic acid-binding protein
VKKYLLDTNVLLRFLLDDHPELSRAAARLFQQAADEKCLLILADLCIAEAVWCLPPITRSRGKRLQAKLLLTAGVQIPSLEPVLDALARFLGMSFLSLPIGFLPSSRTSGISRSKRISRLDG